MNNLVICIMLLCTLSMVAIADTYDAMNSDRIYRNALPDDVIREEMIKGSGHQFDPVMASYDYKGESYGLLQGQT